MTSKQIKSVADLAEGMGNPGADQATIIRAVYRGTSCGASIKFTDEGVTIGSIVEGVDFDTEYHTLAYPFTIEQFWATLQEVENEADYIWQQTHGCDRCEADGFEGEWGHPAINPNCPECKGQGAII